MQRKEKPKKKKTGKEELKMAAEREYYCHKQVVPLVAMVSMECTNVGLNTLFKAATVKGMSHHVFIVYSYALAAALLLLPSTFFFINRSNSRLDLPPLKFSILSKIFLLGLIGMEKLAFRSSSSRAKVLGTVLSISGAFVVTLYNGPRIKLRNTIPIPQHLHTAQSNWKLGGLFLTAEYILVPMWYIVQAQIMKEYPAEITVVFFYNLFVSILAAFAGIFMEPDLSRWKIRPNMALASIVCSGIFGSFLNNTIHTWALRLKGPVYVAMFKPLSIVIAVAMGVIILGDALYLGSILGATVIALGFYTVMWGKTKEEMEECDDISFLETSANHKLPLLQNYNA
ncbi:WAT1-related protein At3g28050-like isoform X3 [Coffea eugenioides]|uniref:WAT1-related protein At3g28050-like isoform X3 n=1 Tax=Coffea eugenioides TaxID=49369 RepID=UPI000F607708|nr:WAT1-related protein At3g28050-like isoform X3 [Coffea eugenioides]